MPPVTQQEMRDALDEIDARIKQARTVKNNSVGADAVKMTECLHRLRRARTALYEQAYLESIEDPEFVDAVARITAAAKLLNGVAANMASAAAFIASLAGFLGAVGEVMPALTTHLG